MQVEGLDYRDYLDSRTRQWWSSAVASAAGTTAAEASSPAAPGPDAPDVRDAQ
jgi:hypothetical protein